MKTPVQDIVNFVVKEDLILIFNKRMIIVDIRINHYGNDLEIDIRLHTTLISSINCKHQRTLKVMR